MHFSRICRKVLTKHNELPLKWRKRFCNWLFCWKKILKESLWKRGIPLWQPCWYFFIENSLLKFLKGSAQFLREKTKVLIFFSETKQSPWKIPLDRKNAFLTIGWRFIAKVWQFATQKLSFFSKKNVQKTSTQCQRKFLKTVIHQKETDFCDKTLRRHRNELFQPCWNFLVSST